jgi:integrase
MSKPIKHYDKWRIRWTDHEGKRRSATFPTKSEANLKLAEMTQTTHAILMKGATPFIEGKTIRDLCAYWLENRAASSTIKRSFRADRSMIEVHIGPFFGETLLKQISIEDIDRYKAQKADQVSPKTLHNQVTLLISMLNLAVDLKWLMAAPRIRKPRISIDASEFSYLRTDEEILRLLRAAEAEGPKVRNLYYMAICTGLRAGELAGLRWEDVRFDNRLIIVQRSFDGPTKSGKIRHVPIMDSLLSMLREWRMMSPGEWVFPNEKGNMHQPSDRVFQEIFHRVLDRAGFPKTTKSGKTKRYIVFHSLRHTFASHWVMKGGDLYKLQRIMGHQSILMTQRYSHLAPDAYVQDFGRFNSLSSDERSRSSGSSDRLFLVSSGT